MLWVAFASLKQTRGDPSPHDANEKRHQPRKQNKQHPSPQADFDASPRWTARELFFWRLLARRLLSSFASDAAAADAFAKLSEAPQHGALAKGLALFLKTRVGPWLVARADAEAAAAAAGGGGGKRGAEGQGGGGGGGGGGEDAQRRLDALLRRLHIAERALGKGKAAVLAA